MTESDRQGGDISFTGPEETLSILVAEDDITLGQALVAFLREGGHQVDFAPDGRQALALISQKHYSLVITDLVMPGADGLEVLRHARQRDPAALVVIMTGYASTDSAIQAIREGAYDYLRKPFNLQELNIAVANAARLLRLSRENQRLVHKLNFLTAQLADLQRSRPEGQGDTQAPEKSRDPGLPPFFTNRESPSQTSVTKYATDLERLHNLYRENLLTDKEYQVLKQRLFI